ncbi:MAG: hypothetical protein ABIT83_24970 [Massilia sp.]
MTLLKRRRQPDRQLANKNGASETNGVNGNGKSNASAGIDRTKRTATGTTTKMELGDNEDDAA